MCTVHVSPRSPLYFASYSHTDLLEGCTSSLPSLPPLHPQVPFGPPRNGPPGDGPPSLTGQSSGSGADEGGSITFGVLLALVRDMEADTERYAVTGVAPCDDVALLTVSAEAIDRALLDSTVGGGSHKGC